MIKPPLWFHRWKESHIIVLQYINIFTYFLMLIFTSSRILDLGSNSNYYPLQLLKSSELQRQDNPNSLSQPWQCAGNIRQRSYLILFTEANVRMSLSNVYPMSKKKQGRGIILFFNLKNFKNVQTEWQTNTLLSEGNGQIEIPSRLKFSCASTPSLVYL